MPTGFPAVQDAFPSPGSSTFMDDSGFEGDILMEDALSAAEALEAKVGISESSAQDTPLANTVLQSLTNGKSKWGKILSTMLTLTWSEADLAADVAMNNSANFFDGPSLTLGAGTWFLWGAVNVLDTVAATNIVAKLWNGTTVESSGTLTTSGASVTGVIPVLGLVVLSGTETWKISCRDLNATTGKILAAASGAGQGNNASRLMALKLT